MIYFAQAKMPDRAGPIKIGYTSADTVWQRIDMLQTACPWELVVLRVAEGTQRDEAALHRRFRHLRMRREWFEFSPELLEFALALPCVKGLEDVAPGNRNRKPPEPVVVVALESHPRWNASEVPANGQVGA